MPRHLPHMIEHPRQNLSNAEPLQRTTYMARIIHRGSTVARLVGRTEDEAFERADKMMGLMGWHSARIVIDA